MNDFEIFNKLNSQIEVKNDSVCLHGNTIMEKSTQICLDCGEEIEKDIFINDVKIQTTKQDTL